MYQRWQRTKHKGLKLIFACLLCAGLLCGGMYLESLSKQKQADQAIAAVIASYGIPTAQIIADSGTNYSWKMGNYYRSFTTKKDMENERKRLKRPENKAENTMYTYQKGSDKLVKRTKDLDSPEDVALVYIFCYDDGKVTMSFNYFGAEYSLPLETVAEQQKLKQFAYPPRELSVK
ncbi:hypothetical protein [Brochothrix campestris]|uniref:Uncharacterized protein n=1 Tax=Brochothrix campestris FSL F6-1037 TaxID=1265861 RepID=W7CQB7_9LIST|nr:hypothetical protein [Brochothrix campestris]EUJ41814.1 hypothetical protein BCAMP_02190 [Brochothrix campestris FSL F6-1037]